MTRNDISRQVAKTTGITIPVADAAVLEVFRSIAQSLAEGESVYIRGFGTFETAERAARKGRAVRSGKEVDIPPCIVPVFRPAPGFKELVDKK